MNKWLIPLSILVFFELVADVLAKQWSLMTNKWWYAVAALLAYLLANTFWLFALKNGSGLARGAVIFSVASAIVATILGVFLYQKTLSRLQYLGVFLGLISLFLIFWE